MSGGRSEAQDGGRLVPRGAKRCCIEAGGCGAAVGRGRGREVGAKLPVS